MTKHLKSTKTWITCVLIGSVFSIFTSHRNVVTVLIPEPTQDSFATKNWSTEAVVGVSTEDDEYGLIRPWNSSTYESRIIQKNGCGVTVFIVEPEITDTAIWVLESAAANVVVGNDARNNTRLTCIAIFTSVCSLPNQNRALLEESIYHSAPPHLRALIDHGQVRLKTIDHTKYYLNSCHDFQPINNMFMSARFWGDQNHHQGREADPEFLEHLDADLVVTLQKDVVLCHALDANKWRRFAYVGSPWTYFGMCGAMKQMWRELHLAGGTKRVPKYPSGDDICNDYTIAPVGNGGYSLRSREWMWRVVKYCPSERFSGLSLEYVEQARCKVKDGKQEDMYFASMLRGMASSGMDNKFETPPLLPNIYEAALFGAEVEFPDYIENRFKLGNNTELLESMVERLWDDSGLERFRRMRQGFLDGTTNVPVIPIGVHKPWAYHDPRLLTSEAFYEACPYFENVTAGYVDWRKLKRKKKPKK